ncbi:hypothetical protein VE25_07925 [Devosia geojensis]|uniref:YCII-related domain-containing protein n=1 Tax=Devosia geojensis TaxID=443610 RepID=A0A0F5FTX6_9HYPH|nr:YciI family protein [Devosia geojensis]KKB12326.1 hypothetical protein VE25_07925 [Devosia geojensis]
MRFMIMIKATPGTEASAPTSEQLAEMGRFNDMLIEAGVLLAAEGLHSAAQGIRVRREGGRHVVTDGPVAESKQAIAGFWLVQVKDRDEAIAWAQRIPLAEGEEVELRQVQEIGDLSADETAQPYLDREQAWREATQKPIGR